MKNLVLIACTISLIGCKSYSPIKNTQLLNNGIKTELDSNKIDQFTENQNNVYQSLNQLTNGDNSWPSITRTGFMVIDRECHNYMALLDKFEKSKKEVETHLNLFTATTAAVQGILEESSRTISLTGAGLGLLEGSWRNMGSSLVFELEPSVVNELVDKLQIAYKKAIKIDSINSRTKAFSSIYNYAELCTPIRISREVTIAVNGAKVKAAVDSDDINTAVTTDSKRWKNE